MAPTIQLTDPPDPAAKAAAGEALYAYNIAQTGVDDRRPIGCVAIDPATGEVIGGLWGRTEMGLLFLDMFFLRNICAGAESAVACLRRSRPKRVVAAAAVQ